MFNEASGADAPERTGHAEMLGVLARARHPVALTTFPTSPASRCSFPPREIDLATHPIPSDNELTHVAD
jgi:hypothetical protein